ncbi:tail protein [Cedecea neteri]|uniref:Tail protein n=1 Tax=Cedecea neteri TaxID=158822 RepID=A0A089RA16_9ENTR|nr:tail protein X [Cedecea neteri]AIR03395.1 tail protein [Cedecea neteri]
MATIWTTSDGDVLDAICVKNYGDAGLNQSLAAVLDANPGLADLGAIYPAGVEITLPAWTAEAEESSVSLWD